MRCPRLDGAILYNRIRDVTDPDFRHPRYVPYVKEKTVSRITAASGTEEAAAKLPLLACTDQVPVLREEYATLDYYELVHFLPASLWREIKGRIGGGESDTFLRILAKKGASLAELNALQEEIRQITDISYRTESENRIQEKQTNDSQIQGMMAIFGGFCILLAIIGIGNVFSNTLGFVRQRRREFARYLSVGLTPENLRKMFCIEAFLLAGRPILLTLLLAAPIIGYMLKLSYLETGVFLAEAPFLSVAAFMLTVCAAVALAYVLGWRTVKKIDLAEVLRDDTLL